MPQRCFGGEEGGAACPLYVRGTWAAAGHATECTHAPSTRTLGVGCSGHPGSRNSSVRYAQQALLMPTTYKPRDCRLEALTQRGGCALLRDNGVLIVGDSTLEQLFHSLVVRLGASIGMSGKERLGSACNDSVRVNFVRNDLAIWTANHGDSSSVASCDAALIQQPWIHRASTEADVVIIGVGQHVPATLGALYRRSNTPYARGWPRRWEDLATSFFHANLNHTLHYLQAARTAAGFDSSSVVVLGASLPVPNCSQYVAPISAEAGKHELFEAAWEGHPWVRGWRVMPMINRIGAHLASAHGATYVSVAEPSIQRPDAARGMRSRTGAEDCMHYRHPGPVDAWIELVFNALKASDARRRRRRQPHYHPRAANGVGGDGGARRSRFFDVDKHAWMTGAALLTEHELRRVCDGSPTCPSHSNRSIAAEPWWPFQCGSLRTSSACAPHKCGPVRSVPPALAVLDASVPQVEAAIAAIAPAQCLL